MCIKPMALEINIIVFLKFVWTLKVTVISMFVWPFARPCFQNAFHSVTQAHMMKKILPMHNERFSKPSKYLFYFIYHQSPLFIPGAHLLQNLTQMKYESLMIFFDLRGHGGCQRPKTPLGGQKWHEVVDLLKKVFNKSFSTTSKTP